MPKAPGSVGSGTGGATVLKRNQACHQCRRRKLKCDARRPCSTCVRSHKHARDHAQPGANLPERPECTFDEVATTETPSTPSDSPKNRFERLETRIKELEALLSQKEQATSPDANPSSSSTLSSIQNSPASIQSVPSNSRPGSASTMNFPSDLESLLSPSNLDMNAQTVNPYFWNGNSHLIEGASARIDAPLLSSSMDVIWSHWPVNLPHPELIRHLVDMFFLFHPHASRLFHRANFIASLSYPPDHPDFPVAPVLHAICAVSAIYTAAGGPRTNAADFPYEGQFAQPDLPDTFAEQQASHAKETVEKYLNRGQHLVQCVQTYVLLTWYYWCHSKWVELFTCSGQSLRVAIPLGLNICPPFRSLLGSSPTMSIISPPRTPIEDEIRRNTFWLAYAVDRQHGSGTGWALSLDDDDIAQVFPVTMEQFELGIPVNYNVRQWCHVREAVLFHPPDITDSFTLYIKSTMLLSFVKNFNHRYRIKSNLGDARFLPARNFATQVYGDQPDIRSSPAFLELDQLLMSFRSSFPSNLKDPFRNGQVDTHLYTTFLTAHVSMILLHEPHASLERNCTSAAKMLESARAILELIYAMWSTNYDIGLLDYFCSFCWYLAGQCFGRFLRAAQEAACVQQIDTLRAELDFVRMALSKMAERVPLSYRYQRMLDAVHLSLADGRPVSTVSDQQLLANVSQASANHPDVAYFLKINNINPQP
ncbi:uncharacterized protein F5891DRAFT_416472 [Suillus fuscotomentosus]|uniref:Zn(2)-C6 fungal-type domain-containing protein n=1 Tax=Suillus fuscotomentosus TaxID=1912939 RepID=A0AAD4E6A7_9AGAM|nr:uncharacterized protein F5891DRAFT_416472 [Suillus fuscotomentosus]KAG1899118.1 hypothetical protein F5891DRAFT_416472 [Suillus fuscotomentosus]